MLPHLPHRHQQPTYTYVHTSFQSHNTNTSSSISNLIFLSHQSSPSASSIKATRVNGLLIDTNLARSTPRSLRELTLHRHGKKYQSCPLARRGYGSGARDGARRQLHRRCAGRVLGPPDQLRQLGFILQLGCTDTGYGYADMDTSIR
jgi:hypothetical protein